MRLLVLLLLLFTNAAFSQSASNDVQTKLNSIHSMSANFSQVVTAGKRQISHSYGIMALKRPGCFRWQTKNPMEQLIVADGKQLWIYDVDLEQVTIKKQQAGMGGTPALFLSGYDNTVAHDFNVTKTEQLNRQTYDLYAKSTKENYQHVRLIFNNNLLIIIEFFDQLGQHTTIRLSKIQTNPTLAKKLFEFKPPKGVDIVQG